MDMTDKIFKYYKAAVCENLYFCDKHHKNDIRIREVQVSELPLKEREVITKLSL